jgi:carbohydrate-selective porin OprB
MRRRLDEKGIAGSVTLINDWSSSLRGGSSSAESVERYLLDFQVSLDTQKLFGWQGGTAGVRLHHHLGDDGSDAVGDAQGFSNIDDVPRTMLYELWFQQTLFSNKLRFKIGKVDANTEFARVENGGDFLNSSMGYSPTILGLPTYPEPRPSVNLFVHPTQRYSVALGLYDTAGPGAMALVEAGRHWSLGSRELPGRASLGYWRLSGSINDFHGNPRTGTQGHYAVLEQSFWRRALPKEGNERNLSGFFQYGSANGEVSCFTHHVGGGAVLQGLLAPRPRDEIGFAVTWVGLSRMPGAGFDYGSELANEAFYKISITRSAALLLDVQVIHHPGGLRRLEDAVVLTPRLNVSF